MSNSSCQSDSCWEMIRQFEQRLRKSHISRSLIFASRAILNQEEISSWKPIVLGNYFSICTNIRFVPCLTPYVPPARQLGKFHTIESLSTKTKHVCLFENNVWLFRDTTWRIRFTNMKNRK